MKTTTQEYMRAIGVHECTSKPTGKFDDWGMAICKPCKPYWIVQIINGGTGANHIDAYCTTKKEADMLLAKAGTIPVNKQVAGKVSAGVVLALLPR